MELSRSFRYLFFWICNCWIKWDLKNLKKYSPITVRYGIGLVFLLLGIDQLTRPEAWLAYFPEFLSNFAFEEASFFFFNGIFDTAVGALLLIGFFTRTIAFLAVLHMIGVISVVRYNDIGIRDFGILLGTFSVLLHGKDGWCLDIKMLFSFS